MQAAVNASSTPFKISRLMRSIAVLAALGAGISSVSLYHHFSRSKTSFCDIGQSFNCDLVNRSKYSVVAGVPVALIGTVGYVFILILATVYREKAETAFMLLIASVVGLGFALYLTYVEAQILHTWCLLCLSSLLTILTIAVVSGFLVRSAAKTS